MIHLTKIQEAAENLKGVSVHTPLVKNENLSEQFAAQVYLKREDLQPVRSYKLRGAYHKICHVLKKVYTFYINTKIRLQFKYNPKIDLQSPFFCNNFSIYNLPF